MARLGRAVHLARRERLGQPEQPVLQVLQQPLQLRPLHPLLGGQRLLMTPWDRVNKHANSLLELMYWRRFLAHPPRMSTPWPPPFPTLIAV